MVQKARTDAATISLRKVTSENTVEKCPTISAAARVVGGVTHDGAVGNNAIRVFDKNAAAALIQDTIAAVKRGASCQRKTRKRCSARQIHRAHGPIAIRRSGKL